MTTYSLSGFAIQFTETGSPTQIAPTTLTFTVADEAATFGYSIAVQRPNDLSLVYLDTTGTHRMQVQSTLDTGGWLRLDRNPGLFLDYEVGTINWSGGQTQVLRILDSRDDRFHTFYLAGTPLPVFTTLTDVAVFDASVGGASATPPPGGFAAGQPIDITALPGITTTEDDHFYLAADLTAPFDAGPGNDLIELRADSGDVAGGAGTDTVRLFGYNFYEFEAQLVDGGVRLTTRWSDYTIRDDVEIIEFNFGETLTYAEMVALVPGPSVTRTGDGNPNRLEGGTGNDTLSGLGGNDTLIGGTFHDDLSGGAGDDLLDGGSGYDTINTGTGADIVLAGAGDDLIYVDTDGQHGAGTFARNVDAAWQVGTGQLISVTGLNRMAAVIDGGTEIDAVHLTGGSDAFFLHDSFSRFHADVTLGTDSMGRQGTARLADVERILAGVGNDVIDLTSPDYSLAGQRIDLFGQLGNDVLWGADSDDYLSGGDGDDTIVGGSGSDTMSGGNGADRFEFTRTSTDVLVQDYDRSEGDTLVFYNRGGAVFDAGSVAMTALGLTIGYTSGGTLQTLTIDLTDRADRLTVTLQDVVDGLLIVG